MAEVLGDMRADRRDLDYLVPERVGVIAAQGIPAPAADLGAKLDDGIWW